MDDNSINPKKAIGVLNLIDLRVSAPIAFFEYSRISSMKRGLT